MHSAPFAQIHPFPRFFKKIIYGEGGPGEAGLGLVSSSLNVKMLVKVTSGCFLSKGVSN